MQSKGTQTHNTAELQELFSRAGDKKLVVIDFFMPECYYCIQFKDDWNKIVEDFTAEYGPE